MGVRSETAQGVANTIVESRANRPAQTAAVAALPNQAFLTGMKSWRLFTSMIPNKISTLTAPT